MSRIFISYRRDDSGGYVGRLSEILEHEFGSNSLFRDIDTIEPGEDFVDAIVAAVSACEVMLAIIGKNWLTASDKNGRRRLDNPNDYVRIEIATALKRNIRVIPVLVGGADMPHVDYLPKNLQLLVRRNAVELSDKRFRYDADQLILSMRRILSNKASISPSVPTPTISNNVTSTVDISTSSTQVASLDVGQNFSPILREVINNSESKTIEVGIIQLTLSRQDDDLKVGSNGLPKELIERCVQWLDQEGWQHSGAKPSWLVGIGVAAVLPFLGPFITLPLVYAFRGSEQYIEKAWNIHTTPITQISLDLEKVLNTLASHIQSDNSNVSKQI
jgi:hypothetical protein